MGCRECNFDACIPCCYKTTNDAVLKKKPSLSPKKKKAKSKRPKSSLLKRPNSNSYDSSNCSNQSTEPLPMPRSMSPSDPSSVSEPLSDFARQSIDWKCS